jgi:hypothetical protein
MPGTRAAVLSNRALNRATLARQLLLRRADLAALTAIEQLAGLQAQAPDAPYVGLWTRLTGFRTDELTGLLTSRQAVRVPVMRATVHLVSARDCLALRPLVQPVLERGFAAQQFARNLDGTDISAVIAAGRALLDQQPRTRAELGRLLAARWPGRDPASLAYAVSYHLPAVQVPPRGVWRAGGPAALAPVESWLGQPLGAGAPPEQLVLRYLAAFGPASVKDIQTWSGLTRLSEVTERLRPRLRAFRDQAGTELYDLPDAPRPDPDTPAPPRFLPEYDNLLLSHADRARVIPDRRPVPLPPGSGGRAGTLLADGFFRATWRITRPGHSAILHIEPFGPLPGQDSIAAEGLRLLAFAAADATSHDIRLGRPATAQRAPPASKRSSAAEHDGARADHPGPAGIGP